ncbi:MAG: PEP-CTERM sorting domain-containing protein, partial [Planctomycetota bacterium]
ATTLTIGNLISTTAQAGYFTGLSSQTFGPVAFSPSVPSSISFGNGTFGSFLSTSITEQTNTAGERSFLVLGNFTGGSFGGATTPNPALSSFTISFTQTPARTGSISNSSTLAIPAVPEPSTIVLATVGIAAGLAVRQTRRHGMVKTAQK